MSRWPRSPAWPSPAGLRPVQQLTEATERVAATGELRPIPVDGSDELARLTASFNDMLGALAASRNNSAGWSPTRDTGCAHTPDVHAYQPGAADRGLAAQGAAVAQSDRAEILDDCRPRSPELSTLVGDLVELARRTLHRSSTSRSSSRTWSPGPWNGPASGQGRRVHRHLVPWTLIGDSTALEQAVLNLLDNAAKWSPPGGTVRMQMRPLDPWSMLLEVADAGPGIAEHDRPRVFGRFLPIARGADDARVGAGPVHRAAGGAAPWWRGVGRAGARGRCAARAAPARTRARLTAQDEPPVAGHLRAQRLDRAASLPSKVPLAFPTGGRSLPCIRCRPTSCHC